MHKLEMTHIEVTTANKGQEVWGLFDGQLLNVEHTSKCFIFAFAPNKQIIKISKKTKRCCHWRTQSTSPVFNI